MLLFPTSTLRLMRLYAYIGMLCLSFPLSAQVAIDWQRSFGGSGWEELHDILQTPNEDFLIGGITLSTQSGDVSRPNKGLTDFWVMKTKVDGSVLWERNYGGTKEDRLWSLVACPDGGYLLAGTSDSPYGGDKTEVGRGGVDYWVVKIDSIGNILWDKTYGGAGHDDLFLAIRTQDGGFVLGGQSDSDASGDKSMPNRGNLDIWLLKINTHGNKVWEKSLGGNRAERIQGLAEAPDGGIVIGVGSASDIGYEKTKNSNGEEDFWIVKLDAQGNVLWDKTYGGSKEEQPFRLRTTKDGGYIVGGSTRSGMSGDITTPNLGSALSPYDELDYWLIKLNDVGDLLWQQRMGGDSLDVLYDIQEDDLGNFFLGGVSNSNRSSIKSDTLYGGWDYWTCYLDKDGNKLWDQTFGGYQIDALTKILRVKDGGYMMGGHSASGVSGNKTVDSNGLNDWWIVKTACNINLNLGGDREICLGESVVLDADNPQCSNCKYYWSDGSSTPDITIQPTAAGDFMQSVIVDEGNLCQLKDSVHLEVFSTPIIHFENDTTILDGQKVTLDATNPNSTYWWSTFETTPTITVDYTGTYAVTVTNGDDCSATREVFVQIKPDANVFVPNAFSPNGDGNNDFFGVFADSYVERVVSVQIFDRWGAQLFAAANLLPEDATQLWDGQFGGRPSPVAAYVYTVEVVLRNAKRKYYSGSLQLLR